MKHYNYEIKFFPQVMSCPKCPFDFPVLNCNRIKKSFLQFIQPDHTNIIEAKFINLQKNKKKKFPINFVTFLDLCTFGILFFTVYGGFFSEAVSPVMVFFDCIKYFGFPWNVQTKYQFSTPESYVT